MQFDSKCFILLQLARYQFPSMSSKLVVCVDLEKQTAQVTVFQIHVKILQFINTSHKNTDWQQSFLSVSLPSLPKFLESSICVVHKLSLSLITLINCCFKFFRMFLQSPSLNGIKMGDQWTLKNLFNNILDDSLHSFNGSFYHSTHFAILQQ